MVVYLSKDQNIKRGLWEENCEASVAQFIDI